MKTKKHRLTPEAYITTSPISITTRIKGNHFPFKDEITTRIFEQILLEKFQAKQINIVVYLFMPNHLHLIIQNDSLSFNSLKTMDLFKQVSGFWFSENCKEFKWHKSYYDHIIRDEDDLENQVRYILNNPVRAGIVDNWKEYPFKGSTVYNLDEWEL